MDNTPFRFAIAPLPVRLPDKSPTSRLHQQVLALLLLLTAASANALEKTDLTLGFIKLTDMAALAVAQELGYFEDEALTVTLVAQPNWQALLDGVVDGELDGAHMLPGQALALAVDSDLEARIIAPFSMDLNGNAITVSNAIWSEMKQNVESGADQKPIHPISASALKPIADSRLEAGRPLQLGTVFPTSTHNYELRYWLAAGGIHPGFYGSDDASGQIEAEVLLSITPPPEMPAMLDAGKLDGYCVGEPWNQQAVADRIGVPVITDGDIWQNNPEKVFGLKAQFAEQNPETTQALLRALIRASLWLDENDDINRGAVVAMISSPDYVGADPAVIGASMTGTFEYEPGDVREHYDFNVFYRYFANYPYYSDAIWTLTQMRRWGQIAEHREDAWYDEIARTVYQPDLFLQAARSLVDSGVVPGSDFPWDSDGYRAPTDAFIDGVSFDGRAPNAYLESLAIGLKEDSSDH